MTQAARVVEDKSTNYWDIRIGDVFVALAHNQATAQKHADQINAALAPIIQQERRKALEDMKLHVGGVGRTLHHPDAHNALSRVLGLIDAELKSIRALRGEG